MKTFDEWFETTEGYGTASTSPEEAWNAALDTAMALVSAGIEDILQHGLCDTCYAATKAASIKRDIEWWKVNK